MTEMTDWRKRHIGAITAPQGVEVPLVWLHKGLTLYPLDHQGRYGSALAGDGVLGPAWLECVKGFRTMLNGELGRLDGGLLDSTICDVVEVAGFDQSDL